MAFESSASLSITKDFDTGAGIDNAPVQGIYLPGAGGGVIGGTATNPIRIDPTGTTIQKVKLYDSSDILLGDSTNPAAAQIFDDMGNVVGILGAPFYIGAEALPLPTGAAKEVTLTLINGKLPSTVAADRILGNNPHSVRLSDGTTFYKATTPADTQPISGTVTANAGTNLNTSALALDATLTGGTAKTINRGGAKGATIAADVTSTAQGADHQAIDVQIYHSGTAKDPTAIRALASGTDTVTVVQATAANLKMDISGSAANSTAGLVSVKIDQTTDGTTNKVAATQATASNLNAQVVGNIAHGSADSGNPVKIGGVGRTTNPTAVSDGQRVNGFFDAAGKQVVIMNGPRNLRVEGEVVLTATTAETTLIAAAGAGVFLDLEFLIITDTSATGARLEFRDSTGGTVRFRINVPGTGAIGTATFMPPRPVKQTTANNNWTVQSSASVTSIYIFYQAIKTVI